MKKPMQPPLQCPPTELITLTRHRLARACAGGTLYRFAIERKAPGITIDNLANTLHRF